MLLAQRLAAEGVGVEHAVFVVLGSNPGQRIVADTEVVHVAVDLHPEELGRQEQARFAIPAWRAIVHRISGKGTRSVLVHAHGHADLVLARADAVSRHLQRGGCGGAAVVDVHERDARAAHAAQHGIGVVDFTDAAERELDVLPRNAGVAQREANGVGTHVDGRLGAETPKGVQAHTQNDYVVHAKLLKLV